MAHSLFVDTDGDRTHDLRSAGAAPFLLGYWPKILVLRPRFELGLSDRKSDGLNRWPNGAYVVVPSSGVEPDFWDFQSRPFPRLDAMA